MSEDTKTCRSAKGCSQIANFGEDLAQRRAGFVQNFESGPDRKGTNHFLIPSLLEWRGDKSDRETPRQATEEKPAAAASAPTSGTGGPQASPNPVASLG